MSVGVIQRPLTPQLAKPRLLWLIAIGLLTLVAVSEMRVDRQVRDINLADDFGIVFSDDVGNGFLVGREYRWDLVAGGERISLLRWTEGL